jgi:hypothetical protein
METKKMGEKKEEYNCLDCNAMQFKDSQNLPPAFAVVLHRLLFNADGGENIFFQNVGQSQRYNPENHTLHNHHAENVKHVYMRVKLRKQYIKDMCHSIKFQTHHFVCLKER